LDDIGCGEPGLVGIILEGKYRIIYRVGVIAYRMLAGAPPFSGDAIQLIQQHSDAPPPDLGERGVRLPRRLSTLVMSALAKNPADRPDSAAGFGSALRASAEGSSALLRHAVSLYSEHFPVFFKLALLASVPLIVMAAVLVAIDRDRGGETSSPGALLIFFLMIAANLFAYAAVAGASVPLVVQLTAAPLRQVQIRTALDALKRRAVLFTVSRPREAGFTFGLSSGSMLFQLLNIIVTPLTAIMTAQLYLKARHAGGETVDAP
jgi:hypothetical protein